MTAKAPTKSASPVSLGATKSAERVVRPPVALLALLAQVVQGREHLAARLVGVDLDVLAVDAVGREQADDAVGRAATSPRSMRSSIACASSYSLRAVSPLVGLLRMSGNLPRISQALKNGCQSM